MNAAFALLKKARTERLGKISFLSPSYFHIIGAHIVIGVRRPISIHIVGYCMYQWKFEFDLHLLSDMYFLWNCKSVQTCRHVSITRNITWYLMTVVMILRRDIMFALWSIKWRKSLWRKILRTPTQPATLVLLLHSRGATALAHPVSILLSIILPKPAHWYSYGSSGIVSVAPLCST